MHARLRHVQRNSGSVDTTTMLLDSIGAGFCVTIMLARIANVWSSPLEETEEGDKDDEEDFLGVNTWTLASVVSFVPYCGFMAWFLLGLQSEPGSASSSRRSMDPTLYYSTGLLYLTLIMLTGLDLNSFSTFMTLLCILHIQVERVIVTEPSWFFSLRPQLPILSAPDKTMDRVGEFADYDSLRDEEEELQLKQFDRLLMEKSRSRESLSKLKQAVESAGFVLDEGWGVEIRRVKGGRYRTVYIPPASFADLSSRTFLSIPSVVKAYMRSK